MVAELQSQGGAFMLRFLLLAIFNFLRLCLCELKPYLKLSVLGLADQRAYASTFSEFGFVVKEKIRICTIQTILQERGRHEITRNGPAEIRP